MQNENIGRPVFLVVRDKEGKQEKKKIKAHP
jgi:hypothetical protein